MRLPLWHEKRKRRSIEHSSIIGLRPTPSKPLLGDGSRAQRVQQWFLQQDAISLRRDRAAGFERDRANQEWSRRRARSPLSAPADPGSPIVHAIRQRPRVHSGHDTGQSMTRWHQAVPHLRRNATRNGCYERLIGAFLGLFLCFTPPVPPGAFRPHASNLL